jgi:hypothetical protein
VRCCVVVRKRRTKRERKLPSAANLHADENIKKNAQAVLKTKRNRRKSNKQRKESWRWKAPEILKKAKDTAILPPIVASRSGPRPGNMRKHDGMHATYAGSIENAVEPARSRNRHKLRVVS